MKKFLIIAADQEALGALTGPHTLKKEHVSLLQKVAGEKAEIVIATPEESKQHLADAEMIAAFPMRMPCISEAPNAKWLHSFSAGVDEILTPEIVKSKIILSNSSGVHATPIAEHIIGFILHFTRSFQKTFHQQIKHDWRKDQTIGELRGSHVLIVGYGEIGRETARLVTAFGAEVSAIARSAHHDPKSGIHVESINKLDKLLPKADFAVITLPYTKETHHLFDQSKFKLMKDSAIVINIGRGSIINESNLIEALRTKQIAGAALDVTETEPLEKTSPLWDMENVILTPHHSGLSQKYMDRAIDILSLNLKAYMKGKMLPTRVDKKLGY